MKTILFQGDSITDAKRIRDDGTHMGSGYALMTAGKIAVDFPGKYRIINRGISGNRSVDLYARIKSDIINLKPDYLSILIGVNDVWHELEASNGVSAEKYEFIYDRIICEVKEALPQCCIIILEPFVLKGSATIAYFEEFQKETFLRGEIAKKLALKHNLAFVPLQEQLSKIDSLSSNGSVLVDGVHPTPAGHETISRELYKLYKTILEKNKRRRTNLRRYNFPSFIKPGEKDDRLLNCQLPPPQRKGV